MNGLMHALFISGGSEEDCFVFMLVVMRGLQTEEAFDEWMDCYLLFCY